MSGLNTSLADVPDINTISAAHEDRLRAIDPLAGITPVPDGVVHTVEVADEYGAGFAAVRPVTVDPSSQLALWAAPHPWSVTLRLHGDRVGEVASALLDGVDRFLASAAPRGEVRHAAVVRVAARDTELVRPLLRHGYAAGTVTAIRTGRAPSPASAASGLRVRRASASDRDRILELATALDAFDAQFGTLGEPEDPAPMLEAFVESMFGGEPDLLVVAESSGAVVGYAKLDDPQSSSWIAGSTTAAPVAYLGQTFVDPRHRGGGVGAALVAALHAIAAERGWPAVLLDYTAPNPLSGTFWSRMGYRPLQVAWQRRPAHPRFP